MTLAPPSFVCLRLEYEEDDSLSFQELTDIGASREQLTPGQVAMRRSKSSEILRLKNAEHRPSSAMERRSEVADSASLNAASDSSLTGADKGARLEPGGSLLAQGISLAQDDGEEEEGEGEEQVVALPTDDSQESLHEEGLPQDSPTPPLHGDGPSNAVCLTELGGESPISLLAHNRMSSESSSSSNPVLPFPGGCKTEGSDSAFSFTSSSLNTGSRSSCEGLTPAAETVDGYGAVSPIRTQDGCRSSDSPRPAQSASGTITDSPSVPLEKKDNKSYSKDEADLLTISMRFRELESQLAGLDTHISQWSAKEKTQLRRSATTQHWTTTREEQFSDLDSHLEQLTSELTTLESFSQPRTDGGLDRGGVVEYYSLLTSQHSSAVEGKSGKGGPHSGEESQNSLVGGTSALRSSSHTQSELASESPGTSRNENQETPLN